MFGIEVVTCQNSAAFMNYHWNLGHENDGVVKMYLAQKLVLVLYDAVWQKFVICNLKHVSAVKVTIVFTRENLLCFYKNMEKNGIT